MADSDRRTPSERRVDFRDLNWFGKTVYLGGTALRLTANLIDAAATQATDIAAESRRAFEREVDPNIEDAKIIEERPRDDG
jgi:hypothetical protein